MGRKNKKAALFLTLILLTGCGAADRGAETPEESDSFLSQTTNGATESYRLPETGIESGDDLTVEPKAEVEWGDDLTVAPEAETDTFLESVTEINTQYIRGGDGSESYAPLVMQSAEEFEAYCKGAEGLLKNEDFLAACERFDDDFWENHDLVLAKKLEGSGSNRHEVISMIRGEEWTGADWIINVRPLIPEVGTCDMALWTFLMEVPKGILQKDDVIHMEYVRDANSVDTSTTYLRTDTWKPESGDESWYLEGTPWYFMDSKEDLETYGEAHPELTDGFFEFCERYNEEFWQEKDLLVIVQREGSGSIRHKVWKIFRNRTLSNDTWFVSLERQIPEERTDDEAIWHFFIEIKEGKLDSEDVVEIHEMSLNFVDVD